MTRIEAKNQTFNREGQSSELTNVCEKSPVRSISAELGVNPDWQQEPVAELSVPAFSGVEEVSKIALMFTLWASVKNFLYEDCGVPEAPTSAQEKKHLAILHESETSLLCLLCLLNNEPYSAGGLIDAMVGSEASIDQRGNARKRLINRTLPVVADRYDLLQYQQHNRGNMREYRIARSARLSTFAEQYLVSGVQQIIGSTK